DVSVSTVFRWLNEIDWPEEEMGLRLLGALKAMSERRYEYNQPITMKDIEEADPETRELLEKARAYLARIGRRGGEVRGSPKARPAELAAKAANARWQRVQDERKAKARADFVKALENSNTP